jgi:high-affinity iron transporter
MLVVGVLYAWLKNRADAAIGMRYLWGGVAAGAGLAGVLALVMLGIASSLSATASIISSSRSCSSHRD